MTRTDAQDTVSTLADSEWLDEDHGGVIGSAAFDDAEEATENPANSAASASGWMIQEAARQMEKSRRAATRQLLLDEGVTIDDQSWAKEMRPGVEVEPRMQDAGQSVISPGQPKPSAVTADLQPALPKLRRKAPAAKKPGLAAKPETTTTRESTLHLLVAHELLQSGLAPQVTTSTTSQPTQDEAPKTTTTHRPVQEEGAVPRRRPAVSVAEPEKARPLWSFEDQNASNATQENLSDLVGVPQEEEIDEFDMASGALPQKKRRRGPPAPEQDQAMLATDTQGGKKRREKAESNQTRKARRRASEPQIGDAADQGSLDSMGESLSAVLNRMPELRTRDVGPSAADLETGTVGPRAADLQNGMVRQWSGSGLGEPAGAQQSSEPSPIAPWMPTVNVAEQYQHNFQDMRAEYGVDGKSEVIGSAVEDTRAEHRRRRRIATTNTGSGSKPLVNTETPAEYGVDGKSEVIGSAVQDTTAEHRRRRRIATTNTSRGSKPRETKFTLGREWYGAITETETLPGLGARVDSTIEEFGMGAPGRGKPIGTIPGLEPLTDTTVQDIPGLGPAIRQEEVIQRGEAIFPSEIPLQLGATNGTEEPLGGAMGMPKLRRRAHIQGPVAIPLQQPQKGQSKLTTAREQPPGLQQPDSLVAPSEVSMPLAPAKRRGVQIAGTAGGGAAGAAAAEESQVGGSGGQDRRRRAPRPRGVPSGDGEKAAEPRRRTPASTADHRRRRRGYGPAAEEGDVAQDVAEKVVDDETKESRRRGVSPRRRQAGLRRREIGPRRRYAASAGREDDGMDIPGLGADEIPGLEAAEDPAPTRAPGRRPRMTEEKYKGFQQGRWAEKIEGTRERLQEAEDDQREAEERLLHPEGSEGRIRSLDDRSDEEPSNESEATNGSSVGNETRKQILKPRRRTMKIAVEAQIQHFGQSTRTKTTTELKWISDLRDNAKHKFSEMRVVRPILEEIHTSTTTTPEFKEAPKLRRRARVAVQKEQEEEDAASIEIETFEEDVRPRRRSNITRRPSNKTAREHLRQLLLNRSLDSNASRVRRPRAKVAASQDPADYPGGIVPRSPSEAWPGLREVIAGRTTTTTTKGVPRARRKNVATAMDFEALDQVYGVTTSTTETTTEELWAPELPGMHFLRTTLGPPVAALPSPEGSLEGSLEVVTDILEDEMNPVGVVKPKFQGIPRVRPQLGTYTLPSTTIGTTPVPRRRIGIAGVQVTTTTVTTTEFKPKVFSGLPDEPKVQVTLGETQVSWEELDMPKMQRPVIDSAVLKEIMPDTDIQADLPAPRTNPNTLPLALPAPDEDLDAWMLQATPEEVNNYWAQMEPMVRKVRKQKYSNDPVERLKSTHKPLTEDQLESMTLYEILTRPSPGEIAELQDEVEMIRDGQPDEKIPANRKTRWTRTGRRKEQKYPHIPQKRPRRGEATRPSLDDLLAGAPQLKGPEEAQTWLAEVKKTGWDNPVWDLTDACDPYVLPSLESGAACNLCVMNPGQCTHLDMLTDRSDFTVFDPLARYLASEAMAPMKPMKQRPKNWRQYRPVGRKKEGRPRGPRVKKVKQMRWQAVRTALFDEVIQNFLTDTVELGDKLQVVLMGVGMDTRSYRLDIVADTNFFEVDKENVLIHKGQLIYNALNQAEDPTVMAMLKRALEEGRNRANVPCDLEEDEGTAWGMDLLAAGFNKSQPTCWVLEGLSYHIEGDDTMRGILKTMRQLSSSKSRIVIDIISKDSWLRHSRSRLNPDPEVWKWGTDEPGKLLEQCGWGCETLRVEDGLNCGVIFAMGKREVKV